MKLILQTTSFNEAMNLKSRILDSISDGAHRTWSDEWVKVNGKLYRVIYHNPSQFDKEGKDVCFQLIAKDDGLWFYPHLMSDWGSVIDHSQLQLHTGRLTELLTDEDFYYGYRDLTVH